MFEIHTEATAPTGAADLLRGTQAALGFVPNVYRVLAEAPIAYAAYDDLFMAFQRKTAFTPLERQVVMMTANFENGCGYCMAGHTLMMSAAKMPGEHIDALRAGLPLADAKLDALHAFTLALLRGRGHVGEERLERFLAAGYSRQQALEVLVGLAAKLLANFASSLSEVELDDSARAFAWTKPGVVT